MVFHLFTWRLAVKCVASILILNIVVIKNNVAVSELTVIPKWNITAETLTDGDSCSLGTDNNQEDMIIFGGSTIKTCSVQLTTSNGTAAVLQVPKGTLLYVERKPSMLDCQKKYLSFRADESCMFVFRHLKLQLFLQGDSGNGGSVSISNIPVNASMPICPGDANDLEQHESRVSQTKRCQIDEFNHLIYCNLISDHICSFSFPANCYATLGNRNVKFQCSGGTFYHSLIVYPTGIITLDLSEHNIINIYKHSFAILKSLNELNLANNLLSELPENVFNGLQNLTELNLGYNYLITISEGLFWGLNNLKFLTLRWNHIDLLHKDSFNDTSRLTYLSLWHNSLEQLPRYVLRGLTNLNKLDLDDNKLTDLPKELFRDLTNLEYLYLGRNQISSLDENIFRGLTNIMLLHLSYNQIISLNESLFNDTNKLTYLTIDNNKLTHLPNSVFWSLKKLAVLKLYNNRLQQLPRYLFWALRELYKLDLFGNVLKDLPKELFMNLKNLEYLYLNKNQFTSLNVHLFRGLQNLTRLHLSWNQLTSLYENLFNDTNKLTYLSIHNNKLIYLPNNVFWSLKKLAVLKLYNNNLKQLPRYLFQGLENLYELDLDGNELTDLPKELFMDLKNLEYLYLTGNQISAVDEHLFWGLKNLTLLKLNWNQITLLNGNLFKDTNMLITLSINDNNLTHLPSSIFLGLEKLIDLDLFDNSLEQLSNNMFRGLRNLQVLDLDNNKINHISKKMFHDLGNLWILYLGHNHLKALDVNLFQYTKKIRVLDLSGNELINIPDISNLLQLFYLNVKGNKMTSITNETFSDLPKETNLVVSQQEICECYVSDDVMCTSADDRSPFLTCDRLLSDRVLVVVMWLIALNATWGNAFVLCQRKSKSKKNKVQNFLLGNLALSDLFMGLYMLLIASADIYFGEYFPMQAEAWRSGITCRITGTISIVSSEASVFFVTLISIDRFVSVRYHNSRRKLGQKSSAVIVITLWIIALVLGVVPSSLAGKNDKFYDNSHVCIGLPLSKLQVYKTNESEVWTEICSNDDICYWKQPIQSRYFGEVNGMVFASVMFLGLNFICYLVILACYVEIIRTVFKSSKRAGLNPDMKEQIRLTAKVAAIVLTDFACWFPIIIIGFLVQAGVLTLPPDVFAWCVTFVLPINSAINPYLYTISAILNNHLKRTRIAPVQNHQDDTNGNSSHRRGSMSRSQNTKVTTLRPISGGVPSNFLDESNV